MRLRRLRTVGWAACLPRRSDQIPIRLTMRLLHLWVNTCLYYCLTIVQFWALSFQTFIATRINFSFRLACTVLFHREIAYYLQITLFSLFPFETIIGIVCRPYVG